MKSIQISDVTLRQAQRPEGSVPGFKESLEIAKALDRLRLDFIELPCFSGGRAEALLVKSIAASVRHSRIILPAARTLEGVAAAAHALAEAKRPVLAIDVPLSTVQMEYVCHRKPDDVLALIGELISAARAHGVEVEFSAGDAPRAEPDFLCRALQTAVEAGASAVTLCDTEGTMLPDEYGAFIGMLLERVPSLSGVTLGVQCSDKLHLAAACSIAACKAGAALIKTAAPQSGLLPVSVFAEILRARGSELGMECALSMVELVRIEKQIDWILHAHRDAASPYEGGSQRQADAGARFDGDSTLQEITEAVARLGYDLSEDDNSKVYEAFRRIAVKKNVDERELDAIVASAALQVPPTYTLESYVNNSGNVITAIAHIKLVRDGKTLQGIGLGDGPIDASFLAIEQIIGHHYELDDFQIQAVTEGREAMGSALVRLRSGGRLYAGKGISTDVIGASIRAYLNALNRIVYEEARQ